MPTLLQYLRTARFPDPPIVVKSTANTTDVSDLDIGLVEDAWKARYAIRDDTLVDNLCKTLAQILGRTPLEPAGALNAHFSPHLETEDADWQAPNDSETKAVQLLNLGVNGALKRCARIYDPQLWVSLKVEEREGLSRSRVDMAVLANEIGRILLEAKSPTVMEFLRNILPAHGMKLRWHPGGSLLSKIFLKAAVYLGLRQLEWLFLTSHNSWIVFRLMRIRDETILAYSPMIDVKNSSAPFRAYFGALLSIVEKIPVKPTIYPTALVLDMLHEEEEDEDPADASSDGDHGDESPYEPSDGESGSSAGGGGSSNLTVTCSRRRAQGDNANDADNSLMITSSPAQSSDPHWVYLRSTSNHSIALSFPLEWGRSVRITGLLGAGSTGGVYRGSMGEKTLAVKIVEILSPDDDSKRQRLQSEFGIYSLLELAFSSGKLPQRIAPQCYGAFGSQRLDALIMELHDSRLSTWDDLGSSEREQIFTLVKQLHSASVLHGDLEPRNVIRTANGGFVLIDFTESKTHTCPDNDHFAELVLHRPPQENKARCAELRCIQKVLRKRQPLMPFRERSDHLNEWRQ